MNRSTRNNSNHGHGNRHMTGRILALLLALSMTVSLGVDVSSLQAYATNNDGVIENVENQEGNGRSDEDAAPTDLTDGDDNEVPDDEPQETTEEGNTGDDGDDNNDADAQEPSDEQDETDDSNKEESGETKTDEDASAETTEDDTVNEDTDDEDQELDEIDNKTLRPDVIENDTIRNADYDESYVQAADDAVDDENKLASLIAVAKSQIGYAQQIQDETKDAAYTLYGDWYNGENTYDDWAAVFAAYCLDKAGFDVTKDEIEDESTALPIRDSLSAWEDAMDDAGWYMTSAAGVSLTAGDIAFLDLDQDGEADHIGIITSVEGGDNEPTTSFRAVIADLDADTKANYYEVSDDEQSAAPSVQEISFPGDLNETDDAEDYMTSLLTGYVGVASYLDYVENGNNGADEPKTIPENGTVNFGNNITKATLLRLKSDGNWEAVTEFEDGDQIQFNIEYEFSESQKDAVTEGTTIVYQLPGVCSVPYKTGVVTGTLNNVEYGADNPLGTYVITETGEIQITFNENFYKVDGAFQGTIKFQGTVYNESTEEDKEFTIGASGTTYKVKKREINNDLSVKKTASKVTGKTQATYTVTLTSENGTGDNPVKIFDSIYPTGTDLSKLTYQDIVVKDTNGNVVNSSQYKVVTGTTEDGKGKTLTVQDLPALGEKESYTITYTVDYGQVISKDGTGNLWNKVQSYKGSEKTDEDQAWIDITSMNLTKTGSASSDGTKVHWTITINSYMNEGVAGTYELKDTLNGKTFDLSKATNLKITKTNKNWETEDVTSKLRNEVANGKITIEDATKYVIEYDTPVEYEPGSSTSHQTNTVHVDDQEATGDVDVTKPDWKVGKEGTGVTPDKELKTAVATWKSTVDLPLQDDNTTGFGDGGLYFTDTLYKVYSDSTKTIDNTWHWTTPKQIRDSLKVVLDNETLTSGTDYTIVFLNQDGTEISNPGENDKVISFGVKVKGPRTGSKMYFSYATTMNIESASGDEGGEVTVWNASTVEGKTDPASQTYKRNKTISKTTDSKAITDVFGGNTKSDIDYNAVVDDDGNVKIYYHVVVYPSTLKAYTLTDTLPHGLSLKASDVSVEYFYGNYNHGAGEIWDKSFCWNINASTSQRPTIKVDDRKDQVGDSYQVLTVEFPNLSDVQSMGYGNPKLSTFTQPYFDGTNGFLINYSVTVSDEFWEDLKNSEKTYENSAYWDGSSSSTETTIKRTTPEVEKIGEQQKAGDDWSDDVTYYVTINPAGSTLNEGHDLELSDTLAGAYDANGNRLDIGVELDTKSVKLYSYDKNNKDNHYIGELQSKNDYTFTVDSKNNTFTVKVKDATPYVLVYTYTVDNWKLVQKGVFKNDVELKGKGTYKDHSDTQIEQSSSSATVKKKNSFRLIKVDSQHYDIVLPNAKFQLYYYDVDQKTWKSTASLLNPGTYTSDQNGVINFVTGVEGSPIVRDRLYKLVEIEAPEGYILPSTYTPYYFVMLDNTTTVGDFWNSLTGEEHGSLTDFDPENTSTTCTVTRDSQNLAIVEYGGYGYIYATNRYRGIQVTKKWLDVDGQTEIEPLATYIEVQLYRQKMKGDGYTVTVTAKNPNDTESTSYRVKTGSTFRVGLIGIADRDTVTVNGSTITASNNSYDYVLSNVGSDQTITIESSSANWSTTANVSVSYEAISDFQKDGEAEAWGDPVMLNADNNWTYTWTDLLTYDENGSPYYYTVKETTTGTEWEVEYDYGDGKPDPGIKAGTITVNNKVISYELPETGGTGTLPYEAAGSIAILGAMFYTGYSRRKRKGGQV